ncbi:MAG: hypothetical protein ACJAX5_000960, partial [Patiriisocius sp.]
GHLQNENAKGMRAELGAQLSCETKLLVDVECYPDAG